MKRLIALMLTVFMILSVCSCSSNESADVEEFAEAVWAGDACDIDTTGRVKIMCMGDSLTAGYKKTNAYRNFLANELIDNGYGDTTCFVGPHASPSDLCPEGFVRLYGYGGNTIGGLRGSLAGAMACDPDIIILMIGTNDLAGYELNEEVEKNYRTLIKEILQYNPDVHLFLGNPIPATDTAKTYVTEGARVVWIREFIMSLCEDKAFNGYNVSFVDFSKHGIDWVVDDWKAGETDHVHPSATGNAKMAHNWFTAIKSTIDTLIAENAA